MWYSVTLYQAFSVHLCSIKEKTYDKSPVFRYRRDAEAKAKGIKIFIATGRPKAIINNLTALQERELIDGYITMNGGYCFVGDEVIYKHSIPV